MNELTVENLRKKWRSQKYHNPCTAWRQRLSPYLKGTVIWQVWSKLPS